MSRKIVIVPHTHWDREWYEPFQTFRMRLVDLVDALVPLLEGDPGFAHFMLDGQMAVLDDYLAVRPEQQERLRRLAGSGRLGIGPWYILMDEFMVSGETIVRDLQAGMERATSFGGAMQVGYLPDMFGHVAQMPQLLRQFGLEHAVVWRGVPAAVDRSAFWWEAPDGSTVRAEYLVEGYGNGADLPDDAKELVAMVRRFEERFAEVLDGPILWMNGSDHRTPKPHLGRVVAEANESQDDYELVVGTLAGYLADAPTDGLPRWRGELRSGARANLLMGVASNRVDVHRACAEAERSIEKVAEPLSALFVPAQDWPGALLAEAWRGLVLNSAHDSSCACSIDEVCDAVLVRYAAARRIGEGLTARALDALGASLAGLGPVAVNPTARTRSGVLALTLPGIDPVPGTQVLSTSDGRAASGGITRASCEALVSMAIDYLEGLHDVEVTVDSDGVLDVVLLHDETRADAHYDGPARSVLRELVEQDPDGPAHIALVAPASQQVLAWVDEVPGFGWARWAPGPLGVESVEVAGGEPSDDTVATHVAVPVTVTNGLVTVSVDPSDGTFSLTAPDGTTTSGLGRLVDDGDAGDTYNYSPPPVDSTVEVPDEVSVEVLERGPLRARVLVRRRYTWPENVFFGERSGAQVVATTTTLDVEAGSPTVRVTIELDNRASDHRLRAWFPLPEPAERSRAECAFAVVERGLDAEGGATEVGLATYPSRRFVCAGGLTVVHDGLLEYELVDRSSGDDGASGTGPADAVAITLLRATGLLSNGPMALRPMPAGPIIPVEGAQVQGTHTFRLAVRLGDGIADAYTAADEALVPLAISTGTGEGDRPDRGTALTVTGAQVSAVLRNAGATVVRVFNPTDMPTLVHVEGRSGWLVDLLGRPVGPFEGSFELGPNQIATARLAEG